MYKYMVSNEFLVNITIHCPICNTRGVVSCEKNIIDMNKRGITAINVAENLICEHSFVTYVDKNLNIRDSYACDFNIEIPKIEVPELENIKAPMNFDLSIIKINLMPSALTNIIRAILMGQKLVFLSDQEFLNEHYNRFLEYTFGDSFNLDLTFLKLKDYKKNKNDYKNHIVLDGRKVIRDNKKVIEHAKLNIELAIVRQFYKEYDGISSIFIFKNEINKIERIIHQIIKYHKSQKEGQEFRIKEAIEYISNIYKTTIQLPYFNFLLDITESYYKFNLNRPTKMADFMGLI